METFSDDFRSQSSHLYRRHLCVLQQEGLAAKEPLGRSIQSQENSLLLWVKKWVSSLNFCSTLKHLLKIFYTPGTGMQMNKRTQSERWMQRRNPFRASTPSRAQPQGPTLVFQSLSFQSGSRVHFLPLPCMMSQAGSISRSFKSPEQ